MTELYPKSEEEKLELIESIDDMSYFYAFNDMARYTHKLNGTWWHDPKTGVKLERNKGEMIALMHSELSEMLEGERKNLLDDHLPARRSAEVELADLFIRALDYAGAFGYDIGGAMRDKLRYNVTRKDHKPASRLAEGGKAF
jgi:hypothetical protein